MKRTMDETNRRRAKQIEYNELHGITPKQIVKDHGSALTPEQEDQIQTKKYYVEPEEVSLAADPVMQYMTAEQIEKAISEAEKKMARAAKDLNFTEAAAFRDEMFALKELLTTKES